MTGAGTPSSLIARVAALAVVVVFLQIGVVSEVRVFGGVVDLSPLVVAFIGLLCGSTIGARAGFAIGLLVDLTLVQTLGLTSLIFTVIGYGAGRLRELRDPQATLTPLLVGAAAAGDLAGRLLARGVHARRRRAGQLRAAAPDRAGVIVVDAIVALPVWALVRRCLEPSLPDDPRRRRRRAYTTGGLSPLSQIMSSFERARPPEPRIPVSSQLGVRIAVLGGFALIMFGIIFFRLWYLQVLTGEQYVQQAAANATREVPIAAPRGQILGRNGEVLVTSHVTNAVQIVPSELPPAGPHRRALYRRLGQLLGMTPQRIREVERKGHNEIPYAPVTIKTDAGLGVLTELSERQNDYPGVTQEPVSVRYYPFGELGAQMFGYVGQASEEELKRSAFKGVKQGTIVGQAGLEYYYDHYLRGTPGVQPVEVNAEGQVVQASGEGDAAARGLQPAPHARLAAAARGRNRAAQGHRTGARPRQPRQRRRVRGDEPAERPGLRDGLLPELQPEPADQTADRTGTRSDRRRGERDRRQPPAPFNNRAVEGAYPTGSTFKPITAMASLEAGVLNPYAGLGARIVHRSRRRRRREILQLRRKRLRRGGARGSAQGLLGHLLLHGRRAGQRPRPHVIQNMANKLGIGERTEIDLPTESKGVVPDPEWREQQNRLQEEC